MLFPKDSLAQVIEQSKRLDKAKKAGGPGRRGTLRDANNALKEQFSDSWPTFTKRIEQELSVVHSIVNLAHVDSAIAKN